MCFYEKKGKKNVKLVELSEVDFDLSLIYHNVYVKNVKMTQYYIKTSICISLFLVAIYLFYLNVLPNSILTVT